MTTTSNPSHTLARYVLAVATAWLGGCGGFARRPPGARACSAGLLAGELVISEIMANPPGNDEGLEWFELYNARPEAVNLVGSVLTAARADGSRENHHMMGELRVEGSSYVVVGNTGEATIPTWVAYGYGEELGASGLTNNAGALAVICGDTVVDEVRYERASEGAARGFDGTRTPDAAANDDLAAWCDASTPFAERSTGTPGFANDGCFGATPTSCRDHGVAREVIPPGEEDLVFTEFHANPRAVADAEGEWFEIHATRRVDLNGLQIGTNGTASTPLGALECLTADAGSYIVFGREPDPAANGGLARVDYPASVPLANGEGGLQMWWGETLLDEIAWTESRDGSATNLDPAFFDPVANDDPAHWCVSTNPYGLGDAGTPGAANIECPIPAPPGTCRVDGAYVAVSGPVVGDLVISEFMANPAAVGDAEGEWIEIRANTTVHLNGLQLGRDGEVADVLIRDECITLRAGEHAVFARELDATVNGGLREAVGEFGFSLVNNNGSIFIGYGDVLVDEIAYASTDNGAAASLDGGVSSAVLNDDAANWCAAATPYGAGDLGTPAAPNPPCERGTPEATCWDRGRLRPLRPPSPGDLVITEIMADPTAVGDAQGEWFEVSVGANVDLNGLQLGRDIGIVEATLPSDGECLAADAGTRVVFARDADETANGGLPHVFATFGFSLNNADRGIFVGLADDVLDAVTYTGAVPTGASLSLDPGSESPVTNDNESEFCPAVNPYGNGDLGSPGAANPPCD